LLEIIEELNKRGVKAEEMEKTFVDVTAIFKDTKSPVLRKGIERGQKILAVVLPKFAGLLGKELCPGLRLGTELSDYAKFWGKVGGIFHTDEMPAYGITQDEVKTLRVLMDACKRDAIVIVVGEPEHASDALRSVVDRAANAVSGIPSETRGAHPDGVSHFSRPRPGAARMYPETDVPPTTITESYLKRIAKGLPEDPKAKISRLIKKYRLNKKLANQLLNSDYSNIFEEIASATRVKPSYIAATLTETFRSMLRDDIEITILSDEVIKEVFTLIDKKRIAKEAVIEVFTWMVKHEEPKLDNAIKALNLIMISDEDLSSLVENVVHENQSIIQERKEYAFGPLMGIVMKEVRGRADAKRVSQLLRDKICEMVQR
jgi:glutamyl-tRNA(Gln) amidotransferase subunit E